MDAAQAPARSTTLTRRQQAVEELCAAAVRALTGQADLHFRGHRLHRGARPLPPFGPHLHPAIGADDFASFRGAADGVALRLCLSDHGLHQRLAPDAPDERMVFDVLEQLRVEALVPPAWPGARRNLGLRFRRWSERYVDAGLTDDERGLLLFALAQIVRARLSNEAMPDATSDLIETTRGRLAGHIGHPLSALRRQRGDQAAFAVPARAIAATIAGLMADMDGAAAGVGEGGDDEGGDDGDRGAQRVDFRMLIAPADGGVAAARAEAGDSRVLMEAGGEAGEGYRVFTRAYDRERPAASLARPAQLAACRAELDARVAAQGFNVTKLARQLKAALAVAHTDGWDGAQEDGRIDGRRLAQLVASPTERRLFRAERSEARADCSVTFLIDCSGSMKARIAPVAVLVDVFARALEMAGVANEVLGFTTLAWHGGRARRDWLRAGQPRHPGRLNEIGHLVFKDAGTPWRRARRGIAALLKPEFFREGVDGEAVQWAVARMQGCDEARRILLVVSDGSPMDAATSLANDERYLDHHLRDVVGQLEATRQAEIGGIGVGLDLSPYYAHSKVLDLDAPLGSHALQDILDVIAGRRRRR